MRLSKYTIFHERDGKIYIFHQMSKALLQIDDDLRNALRHEPVNGIPADIQLVLKEKGFLTDGVTDESIPIKYANIVNRFNSEHLRVTILPTLSCNFRCWYCYESHKPSFLRQEDMRAVLTFIKKEAVRKHIKEIMLDWFGGEPMICFDNIIYPLSMEVKEWAEANAVGFSNMITTNGSLIDIERIRKIERISLRQFQITLDGGRQFHNRTRFSASITDSYGLTVKNIHDLCRNISNASLELRINYTPQNIDSAFSILDSFDNDIRKNITISPHIVWQEAGSIRSLSDKTEKLRREALDKGYNIAEQDMSRRCVSCYTENMEQFVINHDLCVYKCTARDFDKKYSIGKIGKDGTFRPNGLYYRYYTTPSPFMREKCLECGLLPSCLYSASCLQKRIEGVWPECDKELILQSVRTDIDNKITMYEK